MGLLTTTIGAYPKPEYVKLPDWFGNLDTADPTRGWAEAKAAMGQEADPSSNAELMKQSTIR